MTDARLSEALKSLNELLGVIEKEFDPSVLKEGKPDDEGVPGVYARAQAILDAEPPAEPEPEPEPEPPPAPTISELLTESMSIHKRARPAGRGMTRPANWKDMLRTAYELRLAAITQDPDRTDQAWQDEAKQTPVGRNTHDALMAFYADQGFK